MLSLFKIVSNKFPLIIEKTSSPSYGNFPTNLERVEL
jgi:hypothetical protein